MTEAQLQRIRDWFLAFVEGFRKESVPLPTAIAVKLEHTRHVAENAREIARDLRWTPEDVRLAEALGWLHDVGRFAQFAEYGHLQDATSVDHGLRGLEIVRASGILAPMPDHRRGCLLDGIRHHNARTISPAAAPASLPFLKLIRDADKLDIFRVVLAGIARDGFQELAGLWPNLALDGPVNPRLQDEIRTHRHGDVAHVHSLADFLLLEASWIYDLHYAPTRERVRRDGVLKALAAHLPDDPATRKILDDLRIFLAGADSFGVARGRKPEQRPC